MATGFSGQGFRNLRFGILSSLKQDAYLRDVLVVVWSGLLADQPVNQCDQAGASSVVIKWDNQVDLERVIQQLCDYWLNAKVYQYGLKF